MTKYNELFKQQVVNFYFEHHENLALTLKHFNLAAKTVRYWIAQYKYAGIHGLAVLHRKRLYSPEFKHSVVQSILSGRFTMENAALYFGIANSGTIKSMVESLSEKRYKWAPPQTQRAPKYETQIR